MLCTPLAPADIVRGVWLALRQMFLVPAVVLMLMQGGLLYCQMEMFSKMNVSNPSTGLPSDWELSQMIAGGISALESILLLFALGWFGMWMGMTTKRANVAVVKTLVFVLVLPWLVQIILQIFGSFFWMFRGNYSFWGQQAFSTGFEVAKDIFFIAFPAWKLRTRFREMAVRGDGTHRLVKASPAPVDPNAPPVIAG